MAEREDRLNQNSRNSSCAVIPRAVISNKAKNTSRSRKGSGEEQGAQPGDRGDRWYCVTLLKTVPRLGGGLLK
ncbi:hypothetical protein K6U49_19000 [Vibrio alginolyticus]|nr:hypothetical protein [Vibrio alginolyticus]MCG6310660.1 hypothetical protein [Vibrio alginolyticus]